MHDKAPSFPPHPAPDLAIVIPTLNAATRLEATLRALAGRAVPGWPVIVADGGSGDHTAAVAALYGAQVIAAPRGRGPQLAAGAQATRTPWLLFLHADTLLTAEWVAVVQAFIADPANSRRAGVFALRFDSRHPLARFIAAGAGWRTRICGLPYGDQGLLMSRPFYDELGGYPPLALMEDVALVLAIGRRRLVRLPAVATTGADRYERDGWLRRPLRNLTCLALFRLGVPVGAIARLYGQ